LRAADASQVQYDKNDRGCTSTRARAKANAGRLIAGKAVPRGLSADAFIERALDDMDRYVASLPVTEGTQDRAHSTGVGLPVTIEDEVKPAYDRYDGCLKAQVSNSRVSAETILATFEQAMTICASVRSHAVSMAAKALAAKGCDEVTRTRAAETTFAKVDESWLAMAQEYRDMLLKKLAKVSQLRSQ
jgi:hypothetical protein